MMRRVIRLVIPYEEGLPGFVVCASERRTNEMCKRAIGCFPELVLDMPNQGWVGNPSAFSDVEVATELYTTASPIKNGRGFCFRICGR